MVIALHFRTLPNFHSQLPIPIHCCEPPFFSVMRHLLCLSDERATFLTVESFTLLLKGPYIKDVRKIFVILDPLPPLVHIFLLFL